jgi:phospholipid transport system substrate-binding protein
MVVRLAVVAVGLVLCALAVRPATARGPTEEVRRYVEEAFQGFIDAETDRNRGVVSVEQRRAVRRAADKIFDWHEMAKGALGKHWVQATPPQRERFARLFAQLFERLYRPMLERNGATSAAEKIEGSIAYVGETVRGDQAVLHLKWRRPAREIVVDCAMRRKAGGWRIYDVTFDGLSVIENYRAQFDHVVQRSSYQELVTRVDAKMIPPPVAAAGEPATATSARRRTAERLVPRLDESP